jgi:hypothetical protein
LARSYLRGGIRALIKDADKKEAIMSLKRLILQAAELSMSLWTQKLYLRTKLIKDEVIGETFRHDNDMIEPHQLQNKYLYNDPEYFDGAKILMVTHPALVRYGNEEATDFSVHTTLKKAICWMEQPGRCSE